MFEDIPILIRLIVFSWCILLTFVAYLLGRNNKTDTSRALTIFIVYIVFICSMCLGFIALGQINDTVRQSEQRGMWKWFDATKKVNRP